MFTSPFQTLPPLIIDQVLRYILQLPTEFHSVSLFTISASNDDIRPLYHTCHAWRSAALTLMFARCKAVLGEIVSFSLNLNESNSHISNCLDSHLAQYVKTISMNIDYACIADGSVLSRLESSYGMLYFTNAHSLAVEIRVGDSCHTGGLELSGIAERTVQLIKDMAPPLNIIRLCIKDDAPESKGEQYRQLQTLIRGLTRTPLLSHLELVHPCKQYIIESCSPVCNLTTLTCVWDKSCESLAHIMHANANSLLELYISYASFDKLERLVVDEHGHPVIYPHLASLFLRDIGADADDFSPILESIAPFPQLRVFQSQIKYPFGDDTVFRGNSSSLEDIYLMGDYKIIKMLYGCGVFARGRLKSLRKLMVADRVVEIDNVDAVIDTYMAVIDNVLPSLKELRALDPDISNALIASLTGKTQYENLQLLSLCCTFVTLTDVVRLLQSLPGLRALSNRVSGLGRNFRNTSALGVAEVLRCQFSPLNRFFKRWHITNTTYFPENFVIASILLLADICPRLETVVLDFQSTGVAEQTFSKLLGSKLYSNCKEKFAATLFHSNQKPAIHIKRVIAL